MAKVNQNFNKLKTNYLFVEINKRVREYQRQNPDKKVIKLGIGDITKPLAGDVITKMIESVKEFSSKDTLKGYGPETGYDFLKQKIKERYKEREVDLDIEEIFIGDGIGSDIANMTDLFDEDNVVLIPDPVYPAYLVASIIAGRKIMFANATPQNGFVIDLPKEKVDLIYLCSPNNPTGEVLTKEKLKEWIDYANANDSVIFFDAAYESFIENDKLPHSIYEIEGAKRCAIEFCSFSKIAGFTGIRCGYTIVHKELVREGMNLNSMWNTRQSAKYNGTSYISQVGAFAALSEEGMRQNMKNISEYKANGKVIMDVFDELGIKYFGGINSPYIWFKCPNDMESWEFFDYLLNEIQVVGTPGEGFGENGKGFFRITTFGDYEETCIAMERIKKLLNEQRI